MKRPSHSETPATRFLSDRGVAYGEHYYDYVERGGTAASARALAASEHEVVKTLVMEDEEKKPLIVLMHGDRMVSTKELARQSARKRIEPCTPESAQRHTGYQIGGTSPFGTRKSLPVFVERSILDLPAIYINGGRRGFLVRISTQDLVRVLKPTAVDVARS